MERDGETKNPPPSDLHRVLTLRHAVAIYVSSFLGSGIFVTDAARRDENAVFPSLGLGPGQSMAGMTMECLQ